MTRALLLIDIQNDYFPNSFRETPLLEHLRGLDATELVVAGMMTHLCIDTTVRAAFDLGFACRLAGDACATRDLAWDGATVPAAQVQTTEDLCAGL